MQNTESFVREINKYEGVIYKICRAYSRDSDDLKDLYQEVVFQLWKSYPRFKGLSSPSTWIYKVALNTSITYSKQTRKKEKIQLLEWQLNYRQVANEGWEEQDIEDMYSQIRKLNDVDKGIVLLYLDGKSHKEMASITGFSKSNIGTRLHRIKDHLKKEIHKQSHGTA